jgi:hypothetical protein
MGVEIASIQTELQVKDQIYAPSLTEEEMHENILTVKDSDIKVDKVYSKEEQQIKEKESAERFAPELINFSLRVTICLSPQSVTYF